MEKRDTISTAQSGAMKRPAQEEEDDEMLVVGVRLNREVMIGDHTVVIVKEIDRAANEVKLGFDSEYAVNRVSNPTTTMKAAKIRARAKLGTGKKLDPITTKPVHVASYILDGKPQMKAALTRSKASFPGAKMSELTDETDLSLASHQFVVVRCSNEREAASMRFFAKAVAGWPVLDEVEDEDSTLYLLMVRTTSEKEGGDVAYYDAASLT